MTEASSTDWSLPAPVARREHVPLAILHMISATVLFAGSSAISKWLVASYPIGEVLFTRTGIALIVCAAFILPQSGLSVFRTARLRHHALRCFSQACSQIFLLIAFSMMSLAGATAINFSAPLFTTLASALLLKEPVGVARWIALLAGFLGVLIVVRPGGDTLQVGALFALANAVLYGSVTVGVRSMTTTESTQTLTIYQLMLLTFLFALLLPLGFAAPVPIDGFWMLVNGIFIAGGQYLWTRALSLAPASAVAPFLYLSLIWASILGFLIWGEVPTLAVVLGSAIVTASGLYLLWHEQGAKSAARMKSSERRASGAE